MDNFGSFKDHQPNYENFVRLSKEKDYIFQALVHMGDAAHQLAWANTVIENESSVPKKVKNKIKKISQNLYMLQEILREIKK